MISKNIAKEILNEGLKTGCDFAEIYIEDNTSINLSLENSNVDSINDSITYGAGIRLLNGLQSVYGSTNDVTRKGLLKLASTLASSFSGEQKVFVNEIKKQAVGKKKQPKIDYLTYPKQKIIDKLKEASDCILNYDEKIVRSLVKFSCNKKYVTIFNSEGKEFHDIRSRGRAYLIAVCSKEGAIETSGVGPGASKGVEFFNDEVDLNKLAKECAKTALTILDAKECPSGKMPVIIGNGFGGVIFHEACGHSLEASAVSKGLSVFSNKKGTQIASKIVSAVDDGTIDGGWGSGNIDDEGNKTQRNLLIKDGILNSYLIDMFSGRRMNEKANGASRRESYKYEPTSRMSNTFILPGTNTVEEIIKSTKFGLYAKSLGGGSVNPATGEFNFAVNEGYIIKDGEIKYPVKGATLIGSGKDTLLKIDMIANDLLRAQGMCGASSGSIPADVGQPTIRVSEMIVGGRGGKIDEL